MALRKLDRLVFSTASQNMDIVETFRLGKVFYTWQVALQPIRDRPEHVVELKIVSSSVSDAMNCLRPYLEYAFVEWQLLHNIKGGAPTTSKDFAWDMITRIELRLITSMYPAIPLMKLLNLPDERIKIFLHFDARNLSSSSRFVYPRTPEDLRDFESAFKCVASFRLDIDVFRFIFQSNVPYGALVTPKTDAAIGKFLAWTEQESVYSVKRSIANGSPFYLDRTDRLARNKSPTENDDDDDDDDIDMAQVSHATIKYCDIVFGDKTTQRQSFFPYEERQDAYSDADNQNRIVREERIKKTMTLDEKQSLTLSIHILLALCNGGAYARIRSALAHHLTVCLLSGVLGDPASGMWFMLERSDNKALHRAIISGLNQLKQDGDDNEPKTLFSNINTWSFASPVGIGLTIEKSLQDTLDTVHFVAGSSAFIDGLSPLLLGIFFNSPKPEQWPTPTSAYGIDRIIAQTRVSAKSNPAGTPLLQVNVGEPFIPTNPSDIANQQQQQQISWLGALRRIKALTRADGTPVIVSPLVFAPSVMVKEDKIPFTGSSLFPFYRKGFARLQLQSTTMHIWECYDRSEIIPLIFIDFRCKNQLDSSQGSALRFIKEAFDMVDGIFVQLGFEGGLTRCDWLDWISTLFDVIIAKAAQLRGKKEPDFILSNVLKYVDRLLIPAGEVLCQHHYVHRGYETRVFQKEITHLHGILGSIVTELVLFTRTLSDAGVSTLEQKLRESLNLPTLIKVWFDIGLEVESDCIQDRSLILEASVRRDLTQSLAEKYLYGKPMTTDAITNVPTTMTELSPTEKKALEAARSWNVTMRKILNDDKSKRSLQEWFGVTSVDLLQAFEWSRISEGDPVSLFKKRIIYSEMERVFQGTLRGSIYSELTSQIFTRNTLENDRFAYAKRHEKLIEALGNDGTAFDDAICLMLADKERVDVAPIWYTALPYHPLLLGFLTSKARSDLEVAAYIKQLKDGNVKILSNLVTYLKCVRKSRPDLVTSTWFEDFNEERINGSFLDALLTDQIDVVRDQICFYMNPLNRLFVYSLQNGRYALQTAILRVLGNEQVVAVDSERYRLVPIALRDASQVKLSTLAPSVHDAILAAWVGGNNVADEVGIYGLMLKRYLPGVMTILAVMQGGREDSRIALANQVVEALGQDSVQKWARQYVEPSLPLESLFVDHTFLREGSAPIPISHAINIFLKSLDADGAAEIDVMDIDYDPSESFELIVVEMFKGLTRSRVSLDEMGNVLNWLMQSDSRIASTLANPTAYLDREVRASSSLTSRHMAGLILNAAAADGSDDERNNAMASKRQTAEELIGRGGTLPPDRLNAIPRRTETAIRDRLRQGSTEVDTLVLSGSWKMRNLLQQWKKSPFMLLANETLAVLASTTFSKKTSQWANDLARFERTYSLWSSSVDMSFKQQLSSTGIVPRLAHTQFLKPRKCLANGEKGDDMMEEVDDNFPSTVLVEDSMQMEREASEEEPTHDPKYAARSAADDMVDVTVVYKSTPDLLQRQEREASEEEPRQTGSDDEEEDFEMHAPGDKRQQPPFFISNAPARPIAGRLSESSSLDKAKLVGNARLTRDLSVPPVAGIDLSDKTQLFTKLGIQTIPDILAQSKLLLRIAKDRTHQGLMNRIQRSALHLASSIVEPIIIMDMMNRIDLFAAGIDAISRKMIEMGDEEFDAIKLLDTYIKRLDPTFRDNPRHPKAPLGDAFKLSEQGSINLGVFYQNAWKLLLEKPSLIRRELSLHAYYRNCFAQFVDAVIEEPHYPYSFSKTYLEKQYRQTLSNRYAKPRIGEREMGFDKETPKDWEKTDPKRVIFFKKGDDKDWEDVKTIIDSVQVEDLVNLASKIPDKDGNIVMDESDGDNNNNNNNNNDAQHYPTDIDPEEILANVQRRAVSRMPQSLKNLEDVADGNSGSITFDIESKNREWTIISKTVLWQTTDAITAFYPEMIRAVFGNDNETLAGVLRFILNQHLSRLSPRIKRWLSDKKSCIPMAAALHGVQFGDLFPKHRNRSETERMTRALAYILCGTTITNPDGTKMINPADVLLDDFDSLFFSGASARLNDAF